MGETVVQGGSFVVVWSPVRSASCGAQFVRRRVEPSSFVVVRVLASESALSAAGPCVSGRHVPPGHEPADGTPGKSIFFFFFIWVFGVGVCVCV